MKLFFKIIGFFLIFIFYFSSCFSFEVNIDVDNKELDINDYINLKIIINGELNGDINIDNINGLENFDIINQTQSQSSSMSSVNINGKTEIKNNTKYVLNLLLQAKDIGEYQIGPAFISSDSQQKTTNTLNIKISGEKIHLNNSGNSIIQDYNKNDIDEKNDLYKEEQIESNNGYIDKNIEKTSNYKLQNINKSKDYEILLLVIVLITTTLIIYKIYNSNYKK